MIMLLFSLHIEQGTVVVFNNFSTPINKIGLSTTNGTVLWWENLFNVQSISLDCNTDKY